MTAEQLEELLAKVTHRDWEYDVDDDDGIHVVHARVYGPYVHISTSEPKLRENDMRLIALDPSLARRVIAAEGLVEALEECMPEIQDHAYDAYNILPPLITAYREAIK